MADFVFPHTDWTRAVSRFPTATSRRSGSWCRTARWWRFGREEPSAIVAAVPDVPESARATRADVSDRAAVVRSVTPSGIYNATPFGVRLQSRLLSMVARSLGTPATVRDASGVATTDLTGTLIGCRAKRQPSPSTSPPFRPIAARPSRRCARSSSRTSTATTRRGCSTG